MRIAIVTETFLPNVDGIVRTLCRVLDHLELRGHEALVLAPDGGPTAYGRTPVIGRKGVRFPLYPNLKLVSPSANLRAPLEAFQPDLVHIVNPVALGVAATRHARALGLPILASFHTDLAGFARRWGLGACSGIIWRYLRWAHRHAVITLCPSKATRRLLEQQGFGCLGIWARGVDAGRFNPARRSAEWRRRLTAGDEQAPLFVYVGRLSPEKRIDWCRPVLDLVPGARLAIVGDGPQRAELERRFAGTKTVFTGYLHGDDLADAYAAADVLVYPGAEETFGNVLLEGMASGLPVVGAASGGPLDIIEHGQTGFLFAPEELASFTGSVRTLLEDRPRAAAMGAAARAAAEKRQWPVVLDGLIEFYHRVSCSREGASEMSYPRTLRNASAAAR